MEIDNLITRRTKETASTEQLKSVIEKGYKYIHGFDSIVPNNLTLKDVVESMVTEYRNNPNISDDEMAMNIYSLCAGALCSKEHAFALYLTKDGIEFSVHKDGVETYL